MDLGLSGKKALVLAASRGLGLGIAEALAAEGADVVLVGRTEARLNEAAKAISARGKGKAHALVADMSAKGAVDEVADAALKILGQIDVLVNNTGGPPAKPATEVATGEWAQYFAQMVEPVYAMTARLLPAMRERKWGRVLTVASSGVVQPIPNLALSNALRSAIVGWSKTLASEIAADGVTVNMILPGRIDTERLKELDGANAKRSGQSIEAVAKAGIAQIPLGRYGRPDEFGAVAAFLCSAPASYVTGTLMRVDGGAIRSV